VTDDYYNFILGEFYNWVVWGILEELKKRSQNVLIESTGKDPEYFPKMIVKNLVDGVLFLGKSSLDLAYISEQKGIPLLLVGHPVPELELHTIVPDGRSGAFQATSHLIELGHKKIAVITGEPMYDPVTAERVEGYRFALTTAGIEERKEYTAQADFGKPETATKAAEKLLDLTDPPTAFFCTSDSLAYRAYKAIKEKGLKIPKDISIVGFDDITAPEYAELPEPELTTVHVDRQQMGKSSVEMLFDLIQNPGKPPSRYSLPVQLAIKNSTAKIPRI
jgi:DNA-binding LacI/PurR family transcriptional regulator